jgi:hypothetical protein
VGYVAALLAADMLVAQVREIAAWGMSHLAAPSVGVVSRYMLY